MTFGDRQHLTGTAKHDGTTMGNTTESVILTHDELLLLDGKASASVQEKIDFVKHSRALDDNPVVARIIAEALKCGRFRYFYTEIKSCPVCKRNDGYWPHTRSGKWHRKGSPNYDKPKMFRGIDCTPGRITIKYHGDFCDGCNKTHGLIDRITSIILERELPIELISDKRTKFLRDDKRVCRACKRDMYESEMGKQRTIMGDGYFPSICPHCNAEGGLFMTHDCTREFRMIRPTNCDLQQQGRGEG